MNTLKVIRWTAWVLAIFAALTVGAAYFAGDRLRETLGSATSTIVGQAAVGGPFALTDQDGVTVTEATLHGKPYLVFFGFTHCPDVCPTAMFELSETFRSMGQSAGELRAYFVTVDPDRDTPELMKKYISSFDPRIQALTGSADRIDAMVRAWRAFYRKVPLEKGAYTIDHTSLIYLMDRRGRYFDLIRPNETPEARERKLRALAAKGG